MNDETRIAVSFKNNVSGEKKLEQYEARLKNIYSYLSAMNTGQVKSISAIDSKVKELNTNTKKTKDATDKMAKSFNTAFDLTKLSLFTNAMSKLFTNMMKYVSASSAYIENINLLEVAYSNANETIEESSKKVEKFIAKMSEVYGLDESNLTRQFGIFKQLANAMQLPTETAENLSELMVKMTNDIASLYNLDISRASNALQSALAGQVRPIRGATGADITEKTLQQTVESLDLTRNIGQLSYAEKRLIMVISLTNQLKNSQGDWSRTIESTSNQIRIMQEQWNRLARAVGNVFYPILSKILPYVNAILMVLTEIADIIASLLGFEMPKFDYSGLSSTADAVLDLEDSLSGASSGVDKLSKKLSGLRGFDKLNVISTPSKGSAGGSVGGGTGGGIDPKILSAFNDVFGNYNDMLDQTKMKARDIRDSIMDWLGFTKLVNEETGQITWKYNGSNEYVEGILDIIKKIAPHIKTIWEYSTKIFSGVLKQFLKDAKSGVYGKIMETILKVVESVLKMIANNQGMIKLIARLLEAKLVVSFFKTFLKYLTPTTKGIKGMNDALGYKKTGLGGIIQSLFSPVTDLFGLFKIYMADTTKTFGAKSKEAYDAWQKNLTGLDKLKMGIVGAGGLIASLSLASDGFKDLARAGEDSFGAIVESAGGILGGTASGAMIGSIGGPIGTAVGAIAGGIISTIGGMISYFKELDKIKVEDILFDNNGMSITEFVDNITDSIKKVGEYSNNYYDAISKIKTTKEDITNSYEAIETLTTQYGNMYKVLNQDDIEKFNAKLETLNTAVEEHWESVVTATTIITEQLKKRSLIENETADKVVSSAIRIAQAQGDATKAYTLKLQDLNQKLKAGTISHQKYREEVAKLNDEYQKTNSALDDGKAKVNLLSKEISKKINYKSWDDAKNAINKLGTEYKNTTSDIKSSQSEMEETFNNIMTQLQKTVDKEEEAGRIGSTAWLDAKDSLAEYEKAQEGLKTKTDQDMWAIQSTIVKGLDQIVIDLQNAGYDMEEDSEGIVAELNAQYAEIGSRRTVGDVIAKNFAESINDITTNEKTRNALTNVQVYFTKEGQKVWGPLANPDLNFNLNNIQVIGANNVAKNMTKGIQKELDNLPLKFKYSNTKFSITPVNYAQEKGQYIAQKYGDKSYLFEGRAKGGMPPVGQMFIANEDGPELIGHIGGQSFVANQNQMMDLLDKKIGNAQSKQGTQVYNIYLDENHKIGTYTLEQLQGMAKSNGKPITIG